MGIKSKLKKFIRLFQYEVKHPVYIPVLSGEILKDKNVLITGGTSGIGFAIALACLKNGAKVIITGRSEDKLLIAKNQLIQEVKCTEEFVQTLVLDIQVINDIKSKIVKASQKMNNRLDILVNNAGISAGQHIGKTTEEDFDKTLNTNLKGTYFVAQEFSNYLIENNIKGNILNVSSVSGIRPVITPYMLSKWGITGLTEGLAKKLIKYDIVVNGIAPGPTATSMLHLDGNDLNYDKSPCKRYADPIEIANLSVFLISSMGRMIVGDTVYITGGCGNLTVDDIKY